MASWCARYNNKNRNGDDGPSESVTKGRFQAELSCLPVVLSLLSALLTTPNDGATVNKRRGISWNHFKEDNDGSPSETAPNLATKQHPKAAQ